MADKARAGQGGAGRAGRAAQLRHMRDDSAYDDHACLTDSNAELTPAAHRNQDEVIHEQKTDQRGQREHTKDHPCIDGGKVVESALGWVHRDDARPCAMGEIMLMATHSVQRTGHRLFRRLLVGAHPAACVSFSQARCTRMPSSFWTVGRHPGTIACNCSRYKSSK